MWRKSHTSLEIHVFLKDSCLCTLFWSARKIIQLTEFTNEGNKATQKTFWKRNGAERRLCQNFLLVTSGYRLLHMWFPQHGGRVKGWGVSCKAWKGKTLWRMTTELVDYPNQFTHLLYHKAAQRAVVAKLGEMDWKVTGVWRQRKVKEEFRWYCNKEQGDRSILVGKVEMNIILRFSDTAITFEIVSLTC